ncbi:MAG: hypothetical protein QMC67_15520 [Candidatus Wallbacteria bacterium]
MKKKNRLLPMENSAIILLNIVLIFAVLVYGSWFYFKKNSASTAYVEVYAQGAALYYDSFIGYMAKFKTPFDTIRLEPNENKLKKIKRNKYLEVSVGEKLSIKSELIGIEQQPDGSKIAYSEPACSIMAVDKIFAAKISPRFVYKLKIGVLPNGASYIENCDVAGDRFFMFDDENLYNKYKSNVKNFTAVSDDLNYTAIYDFSGNIRIINNDDGKNILLINDLTGFKSVVAYGNKYFIMLLKDKIVCIMPETLKIKNYTLPDSLIGKDNISISNADERGRVLVGQNGVPAFIFQSSSGFSELKPAEEFNNTEIIYFKNNFIAAVSYLASALYCANISDESGYKIKMTGSLAETENFMSAISNPAAVNDENEKPKKFIFYGYSQKEKKIIETLITYAQNGNSVNYISGHKKTSLEFEPAAICAGGYSDGLFILNNSEKSILNIKKGFFYDEYKKTSLVPEEKKKNYVQPLPLNLYCSNGYLYVLFENAYYILNTSDLKILKKFEYCR